MANFVEGTVISVEEPRVFNTSKGENRTTNFIVRTDGDYSKEVCLSVWNDKVELNDIMGLKVKAHFEPQSKLYKEKTWITTLNCYRLDIKGATKSKKQDDDDDFNNNFDNNENTF